MSLNLDALEQHLSTRSYVEGYTPSQADVHVYKLITAPVASTYPHTARWYSHITSYSAEHDILPGTSTAGQAFVQAAGAAAASAPAAEAEEEEIDLFGDDEEDDAEAERVKAERVAAYNAKKANKPKTIAKSVVTLEVKPWDDETDMQALEDSVRSIEMEGLVWGASKLVAIGFGIKKLQITLVVEDELVSLDELQEKIAEFEDYVQSSDVAAMQRLFDGWWRSVRPPLMETGWAIPAERFLFLHDLDRLSLDQ
ncbi:hypothetical protein HYDPIDRAFT_28828 [Hydnomerulius pinastri MD-312]|uniref:Elongation factor 1-beta n=1 Tax=Hydnomerulius pinastri MD-312 TaxID=994086 RepID=A0A0C9V5P7_9AGAM|nr:hypothetical protein HYDPIDRAFT_31769 [Hydnomerulius pinastri MD-312]KIJ64391.1 hypothetical protein HYDPIDRAFT_28828 [Hydnomerulius pinastri MD-312]